MRRAACFLFAALVAVMAAGTAGGRPAAGEVTISVRPSILRWADSALLYGTVSSGKADVDVTIEARTCGVTGWSPWHTYGGAHTREGGGWSVDGGFGSNSIVRARAGDAVSSTFTVQVRPSTQLIERPPGLFKVGVRGVVSFWHKPVTFQRYDARQWTWLNVKTVLLRDGGAPRGSPFPYSETEKFAAKLPKGSLVRATLLLAHAKPCYLAGFSNLLRT